MTAPRRWLLVLLLSANALAVSLHAAEGASSGTGTDALTAQLAEARKLHLTDSTRSRQLAEEVLQQALDRGDRHLEAAAHVEVAVALRRQNHNGSAIRHIREATQAVESLDDRPLLRRTMKEAGHTYWALGDNVSATDYFQRALKLSEEDNDIPGQIDALAGLGVAASGLRDRARSAEFTKRALALAEQSGDLARIAMYGSNLAHRHVEQGDFDGARRLYQRALEIFEQLNRRTDAADARFDLARVDLRENKLAAAEKTLREILPGRRRLRGKVKLSATLVLLADVLREQRRFDEALAFLQEAGGYSAELSSANRLRVLESLVELHEKRGDYPAALKAMREIHAEAEKSYGETAQARAAEVREAFEAERRETEIARLREVEKTRTTELRAKEAELGRRAAELRARSAEIERARTLRYAIAGGLGAGLIALGAIVALLRVRLGAERRIHAETRAAKESAEHADRIKTRFLGVASHDIRGPLGNIINLVSLLRTERSSTEMQNERCDVIGSEAQRVISLVEDLITTAALEEGKLELRLGPVDLTQLTREVIESLRWQAEAKRQSIAFPEPGHGAGLLEGDASRLRQVIANLLSNAIKFSPPGETISLSLTRTGDHLALAVRDRGAGIAEQDIPRLFTPFQRLASSPTAGESSHGLGLSIAQEITRRHGGTIRVQSEPGNGATFTLELPAKLRGEA